MRSGTCPKCGGNEIIVAHPPEFGHGSEEYPMTVTAQPRWVFDGRNPHYGIGEMAVLVCRACGFAEWYVKDPESIPIGKHFKTEMLTPSDQDGQTEPFTGEG